MAFDPNFGFGLMQGGGSYGGPIAMQRMRDPRLAYARELMKSGVDTSPVSTPLQGLARVGTGIVGAVEANALDREYKGREDARASAIANALRLSSGQPAETKSYQDGTTINWDERKPDMGAAIQALAGNRDTSDLALQWQGRELQDQRARAEREAQNQFTLGRDRLQNEFTASQGELARAHAAFMQDRSAANAEALQRSQQRFQAAESALGREHAAGMQQRAQDFQVSSAGPIAQSQAAGTLAAQNVPVVIQTPQGPATVPAGAAVPIAKEMAPGSQTEAERLTSGYADRMAAATQAFNQIGEKGYPTLMTGGNPTTTIGQWMQRKFQSPEQQAYADATMDWIRAKLRKESGAAIGEKEMADEFRTYFPMPGDTPEAIAGKARARAQAEQAMVGAAGRSYKPSIVQPSSVQGASPAPTYSMDELAKEMQRRGLPFR